MKVSKRKTREIKALADASAEALTVTAMASRERHARRLEAKISTG